MSRETKSERDYPYYGGEPVSLSWLDWLIVLAALALGFAALTHALPGTAGMIGVIGKPLYGLLTATLFGAIPLAALHWRSRGHIGVLFNGFKWSYLGWGLVFGVLNLIFTAAIGSIGVKLFELASNETTAGLSQGGPANGALYFYAKTGIQLFGEEVLTIIPFLFLLWLSANKLGLSRKVSVIVAWIGSALIFGAAHLPTYDWNVLQALLMIGPVRLVLSLAYMKTKSIWASTIAHVFNDWTMFTASIVLGAIATAGS